MRALVALLPFIWYGVSGQYPSQDTAGSLDLFAFVQRGLVEHDSLPMWNEWAVYGQPFHFWYYLISPAMWLMLMASWAVDWFAPYWWFLGAVWVETCVMVYGLDLLLRHLKVQGEGRWVATIILLGTNVWLTSFFTNFRSLWLLPLILLSVLRFSETGRVSTLLWGVSLGVLMMAGNLTYYAPLLFYLLVIFTTLAWLHKRPRFAWLHSGWLIAVLACLMTAYILSAVWPPLDGTLVFSRPNRGDDFTLTFESFRKSTNLLPGKVTLEFFTGLPVGHLTPAIYVGAFGALAAGLFHDARLWWLGVGAVVLAGFGGIAYWLPGMEYVSHGEVLVGIKRLLIIIGIALWWHDRPTFPVLLYGGAAGVIFLACVVLGRMPMTGEFYTRPQLASFFLMAFGASCAALLACLWLKRFWVLGAIIAIVPNFYLMHKLDTHWAPKQLRDFNVVVEGVHEKHRSNEMHYWARKVYHCPPIAGNDSIPKEAVGKDCAFRVTPYERPYARIVVWLQALVVMTGLLSVCFYLFSTRSTASRRSSPG